MIMYNVASISINFFQELNFDIAYDVVNSMSLLIETMCELLSYSRMRISFTSTPSIDINLFYKTSKMKLSVNQKKKKKKEKRKITINRRTTVFKKCPMQRFVTLTFNTRLFPRFLSMSLKKILTIQQFCYSRVQSLPIQSLQNFLPKEKRRKYTNQTVILTIAVRACVLFVWRANRNRMK